MENQRKMHMYLEKAVEIFMQKPPRYEHTIVARLKIWKNTGFAQSQLLGLYKDQV